MARKTFKFVIANWDLGFGVILLPIKLEASSPELDHCGSCSSCIDICPTNAIVSPYKLDLDGAYHI